ncbi:MAG: hypothetical protein ACPGO3_06870 [Magnetospiraceae bacterium]
MTRFSAFLLATALTIPALPAWADIGAGKVALEKGDYDTAQDIFYEEARKRNPEANFLLGKMYAEGLGVHASLPKALTFYERASSLGQTEASYTIGQMYLNGEGLPFSPKEAYTWFKKAAENQENPYAEAMTQVGYMHYRGYGTYRDFNEALQWLSSAANLGSALAYDYLEDMYQEGVITREQALFGLEPPKDLELSERGLKFKASFDGFIEAMQSPGPGQPKLEIDGHTYFFERDGEFTVVVPFARMVYPDTTEVYMGTVRAFAKPEAKDIYSVFVSIPGRVEIGLGGNLVSTLITTRERRFTGVWSASERSLVAYEMYLLDLAVDHNLQATPSHLTVGEATVSQTASELPDGLWKLEQVATLTDIRTDDPHTPESCCVYIGEMSFTGTYQNLRITEYNDLFEKLGYDRATGLWRPELMAEDFQIPEELPPFLDSGTVTASLSGFRLTDKDGKEVAEFPGAKLDVAIGGGDEEGATVDIVYSQSPINVADEVVADSLPPAAIDVSLGISRLPTADVRQIAISYVVNYARLLKQTGKDAEFGALNQLFGNLMAQATQTFADLSSAFMAAEPVFNLKSIKVVAGETSFEANGVLTAGAGLQWGASGTVTVNVTNLEAFLREVFDGDALPPEAQALLSLGEPTPTADGSMKTTFVLEIPESGPVLLNGQDINMLQQAITPRAQGSSLTTQ